MTVHIGEFGTPRPKVDASFSYFGETIRVHPDASDLAYTEFLAVAKDIEIGDDGTPINPADNQKAASLLDDTLKGCVHPDDLARFMRLAKDNRQQVMDLLALSQGIITAVSGFPTGQQSASSTGPGGGTDRSPGGSSLRGSRRKAERKAAKDRKRALKQQQGHVPQTVIAGTVVERATRALHGRPDLQLMVMRRQEGISEASA